MIRSGTVALGTAGVLLLAGCAVTITPPEPERFVARQLDAVALSADDFGSPWALLPEEGSGSGPGESGTVTGDPCAWVTEWLPADSEPFYTHSWRMYTTGDGATFASDWITAIEPDVDPATLLAELRETMTACEPTSDGTSIVTIVPDIEPTGLGDGSFSYRADFSDPAGGPAYGRGEVHTVLCGQLWVHLSYVGYEEFVERDTLLTTLLDRVSEIGGC